MQKTYCDRCKTECTPEGGIMKSAITMQMGPAGQLVPVPERIVWDLCGNCIKEVWAFAEKYTPLPAKKISVGGEIEIAKDVPIKKDNLKDHFPKSS